MTDEDPGFMSPEEHERLLSWLRQKPNQNRPVRDSRGWTVRPNGMPRRPQPARPRPRSGTTAFVLLQHHPTLGNEGARKLALKYANELFTHTEVEEWLSAGLDVYSLPLMCELRDAGIPPGLLHVRVNGDTVLEKLLVYGRSAREVASALKRAGHLKAS